MKYRIERNKDSSLPESDVILAERPARVGKTMWVEQRASMADWDVLIDGFTIVCTHRIRRFSLLARYLKVRIPAD